MKWILGILFISIVLLSACAQKGSTTTSTTLSAQQQQAVQQAEDALVGEVNSAVENISTTDIENAITGAATEGAK